MDLELKDVAELLNVAEPTILEWLASGAIPAYRWNDHYRFNRSEIEDWLIQRSSHENFERVNNSLDTRDECVATKAGSLQFGLYRALYRGEVLDKVPGETKEAIIRYTMQRMADRFHFDADVLAELFLDRERMMPTGLGFGIGVPHTRDFLLDTHYDIIVTVFPKQPLDYGALDGVPVHTLFFLFACDDRSHLNLLSKVAHLSADEQTRNFFQTKPSKELLLERIKGWEGSLNG